MTQHDPKGSAQPSVAAPTDAFHFGRNWQRYVHSYLDPERERIAAQSLRDLVGDLRGKTFLDIGCGSGLFSFCAYHGGATQVVSIDVDRDAVDASGILHSRAGSPPNWRILHGSILDPRLLEEIEPCDVVYSWGVLHHTGAMYTAIRNAATLVPPGGQFAIAIYNRATSHWLNSERWVRIKRAYNKAPRPLQVGMELTYGLYWLLGRLRARENPIRVARDYRQSRGMALWTDLVDWLGGYPYEFATAAEIISFCEQQCGLHSIKLIPVPANGTGNNQYVFVRPADLDS